MSNSNKRQFYLTLPSNSSTSYYSKNNASNYITHLPRSIQLDGDEWEVALVEVHFPSTFLTIGEGEFIEIVVETTEKPVSKSTYKRMLTAGDYDTIADLLKYLNDYPVMTEIGLEFVINTSTGFAQINNLQTNPNLKVVDILMSNKLLLMLGWDIKYGERSKPSRVPDLSLNKPSQMYVYCDLVDPQLVGDTVAPLLRIVNINTHNTPYGATKSVHFTDPHYVPVLKSTFETVEIDLRNDKGHNLPFRFGNSCMKLHFRRVT